MLPKEEGNWVKPRWGGVSSREYHCSEDWLSTGAVLAQAKKVAQAFLWIPLPWTSNNEYKPNIQAPFYLGISFRKNFKISSCLTTMVSIQSEKTGNPISPNKTVTDSHNLDQGLHFCGYEFPPIGEIGDTFLLRFSQDLLACPIEPISYYRNDTTYYSPFLLQKMIICLT